MTFGHPETTASPKIIPHPKGPHDPQVKRGPWDGSWLVHLIPPYFKSRPGEIDQVDENIKPIPQGVPDSMEI